jgi:hypothetical protein
VSLVLVCRQGGCEADRHFFFLQAVRRLPPPLRRRSDLVRLPILTLDRLRESFMLHGMPLIFRLNIDGVRTRPASKPPAATTGGLFGNLGQGAPSSAPVAPAANAASAAPAAPGGFSFGGFGSKPSEAAGGAKDQAAAPAAGGGGGLFGFGAKKDAPAPATS